MLEDNYIEERLAGNYFCSNDPAGALSEDYEPFERKLKKKRANPIELNQHLHFQDNQETELTALPFHPAVRVRLEHHNLLVSEVAFALLISLAGLARIRSGDDPISPPQSSPPSQTERTPGNNERQDCQLRFFQSKSSSFESNFTAVHRTESFLRNPDCLATGSCTPELRWALPWEPNSVSRLYEDELMSFEQQTYKRLSLSGRASSLASAARARRQCIKVQQSDTLTNICERYFHDPALAHLLANINRGKIRDDDIDGQRVVRLKLAQEIALPTRKEILNYRNEIDTIPNLHPIVTIVEGDAGNADADDDALNVHLRTLVSPPLPIS